MATRGRDNSRGFHTDEPIEPLARPPQPGEYFAELLKLQFLAGETEQVLRAVLPSGNMLPPREEVLGGDVLVSRAAMEHQAVEDKYKQLREQTRKAEMAVGQSRIRLIAIKQQFERDYPRLTCEVTSRYVPEEDQVKYRIQVAHKTQHVYLIDEEEDQNVFPSEWLLARMGLVG
jgi:hypothetical protein